MKISAFLIVVGLVSMLTACQSCKKQVEPTTLPPETQTGANTFACKVNGSLWLPNGRANQFSGNLRAIYDETFQGGNLSISAYSEKDKTKVSIQVSSNMNSVGEYEYSMPNGSIAFLYSDLRLNCVWETDNKNNSLSQGKVIITKLDKFSRIISGTFYFTIENSCGKIEVTDGRFDLKF